MYTRKRTVALVASTALAGGLLMATAPVQAGTSWSGPQQVSSKLGRSISFSEDGVVAAWIRTNKWSGSGPVRTAVYRSPKKGWSPSAPIPGTVETTSLQLAWDGSYALMKSEGTGYVMAKRASGTTWGTPTTVAAGTFVDHGQMSKAGDRVVWVDWGPDTYPSPAGQLEYRSRNADGTWTAPVTIGTLNGDLRTSEEPMVVLSYEGNAVAWIDETYALVVSTMTSMGTWSAPVKIKQFTNDPYLNSMAFSAGGSRLIWARWDVEGVFLTQTTPTGWSPADYVVVDDVTAAALSPNGSTIVWGNDSNQVLLVQFKDGAWKKAKVLGSSSRPSLAVANKTVAWTSRAYAATTLRASVRTNGKWSSSVRLARQAFSPAVSFNSRTVAWADPNNKQLLSVKR